MIQEHSGYRSPAFILFVGFRGSYVIVNSLRKSIVFEKKYHKKLNYTAFKKKRYTKQNVYVSNYLFSSESNVLFRRSERSTLTVVKHFLLTKKMTSCGIQCHTSSSWLESFPKDKRQKDCKQIFYVTFKWEINISIFVHC